MPAFYSAVFVIEVLTDGDPRLAVRLETYVFTAETPEAACDFALRFAPRLDHAYRDRTGRPVRERCRGVHNVEAATDLPASLASGFRPEHGSDGPSAAQISIATIEPATPDLIGALVKDVRDFDVFWRPASG